MHHPSKINHPTSIPLVDTQVQVETREIFVAEEVERVGGQNQNRPQRIGVFIVHGMGQQRPFETVDLLTQGLLGAIGRCYKGELDPNDIVSTTQVRFGENEDAPIHERAEIHLSEGDERLRLKSDPTIVLEKTELHLYESYWAPLTQGVVSARAVFGFLLSGLKNGLLRSLSTRDGVSGVRRWMFGAPQELQGGVKAFFAFLVVGLILGVLLLINALATVVIGAHLLSPAGIFSAVEGSWPSPALLSDLTSVTALVVLALVLFFLSLALPAVLSLLLTWGRRRSTDVEEQPKSYAFSESSLGWFARVSTLLGGVAVVAMIAGGYALIRLVVDDHYGADPFLARWSWTTEPIAWYAVWGSLFLTSLYVRGKIIAYVGDVVAYIATTRLDSFAVVRSKIKARAFELLRTLYRASDGEGGYLYDKIIVVGHSLGSVIAYDALNRVINEDRIDGEKAQAVERTGLFITFGSPLDKTAYIFSILTGENTGNVREKLATSKQPLIESYRFRKFPWINVYARMDIISGPLDYYDKVSRSELPFSTTVHRVENITDPTARMPLVAHTTYWHSDTVFDNIIKRLF